MSIRRPFIACAALAAALTSGALTASAAASPSTIALQKSDLSGYTLKSKQTLNAAAMAKVSGIAASQFTSHGFLTGVVLTYVKGKVLVESFATQYKTAAGASWEYGKSKASDLKGGTTWAAKVGSQSTGFTKSGPSGVEYGVDFQQGVYDMTAAIGGPRGSVSSATALHLAKVMAGRAH